MTAKVKPTPDQVHSDKAWKAYQTDAAKDDAAFLAGWKGYWDIFTKTREAAVDAPESENTQQTANQATNAPDPSQASANGISGKQVSDRPDWIEPELEDGEWED